MLVGRLSSSFGENTFFHGKLRTWVCSKEEDAHQPCFATEKHKELPGNFMQAIHLRFFLSYK